MPTVQVWIPDSEISGFLRAAKRDNKTVGAWLVGLGRRAITDDRYLGKEPPRKVGKFTEAERRAAVARVDRGEDIDWSAPKRRSR